MKRIVMLAFALIILAGTAMAGEMTIEWKYPAEMNGAILGFRIYHAKKSIPWGKHKGELPPADANMQMLQVDDPSLRTYKLVLPEGPNYIRMNAIYTQNSQVVESFFSEQTKVDVKATDVGGTSPSDLKLRNTSPSNLKVK